MKNCLDQLIKNFENGIIDKKTYIDLMYKKFHSSLFEYQEHLYRTNIKEITIRDQNVQVITRNNNIVLECLRGDKRNHPFEILNFSDVEKNEIAIMNKILLPGASIIDIGANIGWHSINLSVADSTRKIYAIEPTPDIYKSLNNNILLNNRNNIYTYNFGISNKNEIAKFYFNKDISGNSSLKKLSKDDELMELEIKFITLDNFIEKHYIKKLDFIKCDVEGAELLVLQGGLNTIDQFRPIIFAEILRKWSEKFNYDCNEIFSLLKSKNYSSYSIDSAGNLIKFIKMDHDTISTNFFFFHNDHHKNLIEIF